MDLYDEAYNFRRAWIEAIRDGEIKNHNMCRFPNGCCSYASDLLQRYFAEHDFFTWYMSGTYGYGEKSESHAWLETYDHSTVIDITGDQYQDRKPPLRFDIEVYVGPKTDMHKAFQMDEPIAYRVNESPFGKSKLEMDKEEAYEAILKMCYRI